MLWIVLLLELDETVPVLAERRFDPFSGLVAPKELHINQSVVAKHSAGGV